MLIFAIFFTTLVWIGDIISWAWIGNGFTIDIVLFIIAVVVTIGVIGLFKSQKQKREKMNSEHSSNKIPTIDINESPEMLPITCSSCGDAFQYRNEVCPSCGSEKPKCFVCLSDFSSQDDIIKTTCCQKYAHKEHVLNWLNIDGRCPNCKQEITKDDLIRVSFAS